MSEADFGVVASRLPDMVPLIMLSVICTMTGVLGIAGKFSSGPDGDPAPDEVVDFDAELTTVGLGSVIVGLTNGVVTFHRLGSSIQLRLDGGTHRLGVMSSALFVGIFFFTSTPLGHCIPKWFLGGLFMGSGVTFLEGAFYSYTSLPRSEKTVCGCRLPSLQYYVTVCCIVVAIFTDPFSGIGAGLALSVAVFMWDSANTSPVSSIASGNRTISRTARPFWELKALCKYGGRVVILYLQGQLFFGSGQTLVQTIQKVVEGEHSKGAGPARYCILSFAKVDGIDASAAEQLRLAMNRVARHGCKVIFCRMNLSVFRALSLISAFVSPNKDLRNLMNDLAQHRNPTSIQPQLLKSFSDVDPPETQETQEAHAQVEQREEEEAKGAANDEDSPLLNSEEGILFMQSPRPTQRRRFRPLGQGDHDAFDHETDALDYCGDQILAEFCYGETREVPFGLAPLEPYMVAFRSSCTTGSRLTETTFEKMNNLPAGFMNKLKPHIHISHLQAGDTLGKEALHLLLQGSIATVDTLEHNDPTATAFMEELSIHYRGFGGRGGKRLRKRHTPGTIVGKVNFFLHVEGTLADPSIIPMLIVSSKFSPVTEVWSLTRTAWEGLRGDLRLPLQDCCLRQLVDERQHTLLSGE